MHPPQPSTQKLAPVPRMVTAVAVSLLFLSGFVLQLAGVGAVHDHCKDAFQKGSCEDRMRQFWWAIFFELLVGVGTAAAFFAKILEDSVAAVVAFVAIATVKSMDAAEGFLRLEEDAINGWPERAEARTAAAGFMLTTAANFVLILVIGSSRRPQSGKPRRQQCQRSESQPVTEKLRSRQPAPQTQIAPRLPQMQEVVTTPETDRETRGQPQAPQVQVRSPAAVLKHVQASLATMQHATNAAPATQIPPPPKSATN